MSTYTEDLRKVTTRRLAEMKQRGEKISMLTAYDYSMASLINVEGRDDAEEGQNRLIAQRFELKGFAVNAHGAIHWDFWRFGGELIAGIHIKRRLIARALPIGGHLDAVERFCAGVERLRQFGRLVVIMEIPFSGQNGHQVALVALL